MTVAVPSGIDGVIVGPTSHPIVPLLAEALTAAGMRIAAVNGGGSGDTPLTEHVPVLGVEGRIPDAVRRRLDRTTARLDRLERWVVGPTSRRSLARLETEFGPRERARVAPAVQRGAYAAAVVDQLRPRFVWLNHVFQFGAAVPLLTDVPVLAMPWGGDIYNLGEATPLARRIVRSAVQGAAVVVPSAVSASSLLVDRYGADPTRIVPLSWGVDLDEFRERLDGRKAELRVVLGLPQGARVVFNSRRLKPAWGSDVVFGVMTAVAEARPETHHVVIAGDDGRDSARAAGHALAARGLADRFTVIDHDISMGRYLDFCAASDVAVSLRTTPDMRSLSLLQAAAAGLDIVTSDQPEYREMQNEGFAARFVDAEDRAATIGAVLAAVDSSPAERARIAAAGRAFVERHEDRRRQLERLVDLVERTATSR